MGVLYEEIKAEIGDVSFVYYAHDPNVDVLLVMCACQCACATIPDDIKVPVIVATPFSVNNRKVEAGELKRSIMDLFVTIRKTQV